MLNFVIIGLVDMIVRVWRCDVEDVYICLFVMVGYMGFVKLFCVFLDMVMGVLVYSGSMDGDICVWWLLEDEMDFFLLDDSFLDSFVVINWRLLLILIGFLLCCLV